MAASYADADGRCVASPARAEQPRLQILKQALAQGGAKCIPGLRRWAKEKRQYRGEVFSLEEVEEAVAAWQASKETGATTAEKGQTGQTDVTPPQVAAPALQSVSRVLSCRKAPTPAPAEAKPAVPWGGLRVTLRSKSWPWPLTLEAAKVVAQSMGPCHDNLKVSADLLKTLFEVPDGALHPDLVLVAGSSGHRSRIGAHKAILASFSDFFRLKFHGAYRDSAESLVEVTWSPDVVRAALQFLYTGSCELDVAVLGDVMVMADFWQANELADAAAKSWYALPMVHQLEVLSNLDETSTVPKAMVGALVESLTLSFQRAANELIRDGPSRQLLREMGDWLCHTPGACLDRLKHWLSLEEEELRVAVEHFMRSALQAANSSEDLRKLLRPRALKSWLPPAMLQRLAFHFIEHEPAFKEEEQVAFWVTWCTSGGFSCDTLVEIYEAIAAATNARAPLLTLVGGDPKVAPALPEDQVARIQRLLMGLKRAFGVALAEQSYVSDESRFWQRWTQGTVPNDMLQHAAQCLGFSALHGRPFPAVSPAVVRAALSEALAKAEVAMLAVQGPKAVEGLYQRKGQKFQCQKGQETLMLMYTEQQTGKKDDKKLNIIWNGLPVDEWKKAKGIWSIQTAGSDEVTPPLAVLLSRQVPWGLAKSHWWLPDAEGRFKLEPSMAVELDEISDAEASKLKHSLISQHLPELLEVVDSPAARKLCQALQRERAEAERAEREKQNAFDAVRCEEDSSEWQQAAKVFDTAAAQLCQILQELQGADASIRRRLLAKKRRLETDENFVAALKRLEREDGRS